MHGTRAVPESLEQLVSEFARLPGIGRRTAQRLAFHVARDHHRSDRLARALDHVRERLVRCTRCHGFAEAPVCAICADPRRDRALVCVVEEPTDVVLLEHAAPFAGLYHVLGGALSPTEGVDPSDLTLDGLVRRVDADGVREVVVATGSTMSGEATASYIADALRGRTRVTRPASGLAVGADLDQADDLTLGRAFSARREL